MTFSVDVAATAGLAGAHRPGLQALTSTDRNHVSKRQSTNFSGSVNLDAALAPLYPNANRWDYVIAERRSANRRDLLHWVEIHPASGDSNVREVAKKGAWLLGWLKGTPLADYERRVIWIASGRSAFNARDPKLRALATQGIQFAGGHWEI